MQGVRSVKKSTLDCKYLFIKPPSILDLEKRLKGRDTETQEKIKVRLENAVAEIEYGNGPGNFDACLVNEDLNSTFAEFVSTLQKWYPDIDLYMGAK